MLGSGMKKLARQHNMTLAKGLAYGDLMGYATTLSEGAGYKKIVITTKIPDPVQLSGLQTFLNGLDLSKIYRVQQLSITPNAIHVVFRDTVGTMNMVEAFVNWFYPILTQAGATRSNLCSQCGGEVLAGHWILIDDIAY